MLQLRSPAKSLISSRHCTPVRQDDDNLTKTVKIEKEKHHLSCRSLGRSSDSPRSWQPVRSRKTVKQCLTSSSILEQSDVEAARVIFSGFTERDREAAINSVISSTLFLCSQFCDAIHSRNDQHNLSKAHAHAFPSMINTHDVLERGPLTLSNFTEFVTNQLGSPAEAESGPADVYEWAATFVTEAPSLVERDHAS